MSWAVQTEINQLLQNMVESSGFFFCRLEGSFEIFTKILASHAFQLPVSILAVSLKKNLNDLYSAIVLGD